MCLQTMALTEAEMLCILIGGSSEVELSKANRNQETYKKNWVTLPSTKVATTHSYIATHHSQWPTHGSFKTLYCDTYFKSAHTRQDIDI